MGYNEDVVEIGLSSAIDAVFAGLPNMYLTETKCRTIAYDITH